MQWHRLRLVRQDGEVRLYVNNLAEPIFVAQDSRFPRGWLGFGSFDDTGRFDDIHIWAPAETAAEKEVPSFDAGN